MDSGDIPDREPVEYYVPLMKRNSTVDATQRRFEAALNGLVEQIKLDRSILAAILCGSLSYDNGVGPQTTSSTSDRKAVMPAENPAA